MRPTLLCLSSALFHIAGTVFPALGCVDVALVLAVDGSDSVDEGEYRFQTSSIATAFRDKAVLHAMKGAGIVAVSAVFWGDGQLPSQELDWVVVNRGEGAEFFARKIETNLRAVYGNTDIGNGIWAALDRLSSSDLCARRSVIDISGDGRETLGPKRENVISLHHARRRAKEMRVTINGLAISDDGGDLARYYAGHVVLGSDAFVMHINKYADYSVAIRKKLVAELSYGASGYFAFDEAR
ncbi:MULTISPECIES: DUF1194 domain-containing protein [Rhizobium/Agrobacterium group]|uniref:DUF1194 domain-containing protein n=1 Tax=Rhizobium/Agrobacterium group TaxID=227290 RepID=UPI0010E05332|nr:MULTISPECIES: DUF1194 domain-containing protein [Rhizobium/Agrobacterium group]TCR90916.1 uncharacterized protein DUF1194 [Rhizobium sp. BK376]